MDEMSWRARLARKNINILNVDDERGRWYYEFMYHPYSGSTKWSKTFFEIGDGQQSSEAISRRLEQEVLKLRKELER